MNDPNRRLTTFKEVEKICNQPVPLEKIEQLRNRVEKSPAEKCKENNAVAEQLKKQIGELSGIRKSDTVEARIEKIEGAIGTLREQSKPLKKSLNTTLFSTDTELLELVAQTTHDTLLEIGGATGLDPADAGQRVGQAIQRAKESLSQYQPDRSEWCSEWILEDDEEQIDEMYNDIFGDSDMLKDNRFGFRAGFFHRHQRELFRYSLRDPKNNGEKNAQFKEPGVWPFNAEQEFMLQLVDVERVEKVKKVREKVDKEKKAKEKKAELVKVNDKAKNVQSEEVSISKELAHVCSVFKKELKHRKTDHIGYYEFVTNPDSFSRTVENMFYVSYLMRDREMYLIEEKNVPVLKRSKDEAVCTQLTAKCSWHGVTSLSHEQWLRLSKVFKTAIIKPLEN